tara:strand:+ start:339 stop:608 length:270 start_codon:yes stop_codon:yes gene_type:complete
MSVKWTTTKWDKFMSKVDETITLSEQLADFESEDYQDTVMLVKRRVERLRNNETMGDIVLLRRYQMYYAVIMKEAKALNVETPLKGWWR